MSLKLKSAQVAPMRQLSENIGTMINSRADNFVSATDTGSLVSMESMDGHAIESLNNRFQSVRQLLRNELQKANALGLGMEDLTNAEAGSAEAEKAVGIALDAGAMAAMAAGNPEAYAKAAYTQQAEAAPGVVMVDAIADGVVPGLDYRPNVALEAFNERELRDHLPHSIVFNIFASRQDDVAEMLFPTTVVPPDQAGLDLTVSRMTVFNEVRHKANGNKIDFGKRNLIDAAVNHQILEGQTTRLVPVVAEDGSNADKFVDDAIVGEFTVPVAGYEVPTAPLAMDTEIDLIGISQFQPLVGAGIIDHSDDVDARVVLENLYLQAGTGTVGIAFPTARLARSAFNKTVEGNSRLIGLQFTSTDLVIDKTTKAVDQTDVAAFALIASNSLTVRLAVNVSGELNVEFGNVKVWAAKVGIESIQDANGVVISKTSGIGAQVVTALAGLSIVGYTLLANRTNANLRTRGHLLDTVYETQRYTIPLGSPLSITSPVTSGGARDAADQKALIAAARTRNTNNAITALFATADQLRAAVRGPKHIDGTVSGVGGMGRFLVDPFFEEHTLDLVQSLNNIESLDKAASISSVLVNAARDIAYRMYQQTKIQPAIDQLTGTAGQAPTLLVATDQVLIRHLMVGGDARTFGTVFDKAVVKASTDRRMYGKIIITMSISNVEGPHPLTFGTHAWMSELIGLMPVSRNGATTREATVQPRTLHINNLPVLAIIDVKGLTKALVDKIEMPKLSQTTAENVYLDGLRQPVI